MVHFLLLIPVLTSMLAVKNRKFFLKLTFFELFLFAALRYQFGNDYMSYYNKYLTIQRGGNPFRAEVLFTALCRIMPSYYWLVAFVSLVYIYALYYLVNENIEKRYIWQSIAVLLISSNVFLIDLSAMRQCLAITVFVFATSFAYNKRIIPYIVSVLVASLFHTSALILLPIYWYINIKGFNKTISFVTVCLLVVMLMNEDLFNKALEWVIGQFEGRTSWSYAVYLEAGNHNSLRATLLSSITLIYLLINLPHLNGKVSLYAKLWLFAVVVNVLAIRVSMLTRIEMYFNVFSIVAFPLINCEVRKHPAFKSRIANVLNQVILPSLIVVVFILRYYSFFTNPLWKSFHVYHTIFELL